MTRQTAHLHDVKLDALDELIEELNGQQLLLAYEFRHDADRLKRHYGDKLTVLGKGDSSATVEAWNRGEIPLLACHPASAAHGLNLQYSSCAHVAWFSPIWDLELYQQFIRRIRRQGNDAQRIVNHLLVVRDTIDELALAALRDKDTTQARLLHSLNAEISGQPKETETMSTVTKLSRQSDAGGEPRRIVPKGWGAAATAETPLPESKYIDANGDIRDKAANDAPTQRERIQQQIAPNPVSAVQEGEEGEVSRSEQARSAFSQGVQAQRQALEEGKQTDLEDAIAEVKYEAKPEPAADPKPVRSRKTTSPFPPAAVLTTSVPYKDGDTFTESLDYDKLAQHVVKQLIKTLTAAL